MEDKLVLVGFAVSDEIANRLQSLTNVITTQTQLFSRDLITSLNSAGVKLLLESLLPIPDYPLGAKKVIRGETFEYLGARGHLIPFINLPLIKHLSRLVSLLLFSTNRVRKFRPTTVLIYSVNSALLLYGIFLKKVLDVKITVIFLDPPGVILRTDSWFIRAMKRVDIHFARLLLREYETALVLSPQTAADFFTRKPTYLLNGFVSPDLMGLRHEKQVVSKRNNFSIVYAGNLAQDSGVLNLVEAVTTLKDLDVSLDIYGSGFLENDLVRLCESSEKVNYKGKVTYSELTDAYLASQLLVNCRNPGSRESKYIFPSKIHEYMAFGIPVASTKLPGIPAEYFEYIVDFGNGSVAEIRDGITSVFEDYSFFENRASEGLKYLAREKTPNAIGPSLKKFLFT